MDELAQWIINVGTGALLGFALAGIIILFIRLAEAMPNHIPVLTPTWNAIKGGIRKPIDALDRKLNRD